MTTPFWASLKTAEVKLISETAIAPTLSHRGDAGRDIYLDEEEVVLLPFERHLCSTGFCLMIPEHQEVQIRSRSGLAVKQGVKVDFRVMRHDDPVQVLNHPGTIDSSYTGEIKVCLINLSDTKVTLMRGDRIAQMVDAPVITNDAQEVAFESDRGDGGFGSTGVSRPILKQTTSGNVGLGDK